jgi:hypothetical protein
MVVGHVQPPSYIVMFTQAGTNLLPKRTLPLVQWSIAVVYIDESDIREGLTGLARG